jgi:hypothetical protein
MEASAMTKRHAKPTSAKKRKLPRPALIVCDFCYAISVKRKTKTAQLFASLSARLDSMYTDLHANDCLTHRRIEALTDLMQILTDSHTGQHATIVDHCARLLKEKETLQRQVANMKQYEPPCEMVEHFARAAQIDGADLTFSGEPRTYGGIPGLSTPYPECLKMTFTTDSGKSPFLGVLGGPCTLAHLHRPGIRCGVCGETPDGISYDLT